MNTLDRSLVLIVLLLASYSLAVKPSCKVCKDFVQAFNKRMDDTAKSNFADGDTNWEEEKLASYANSEVRLIEMLDEHSNYDCHRLLENYEEDIERWWFKLRHKEEGYDDLKQWLCSTNLDG
ncbi:cysteine-rich with EGF-like domain protein 2-A isoform X2 [Halichondria panicea]|uniref:cysteine-rich with EGF-like domain protein 2-A isoform X2 n=1 Tax=Halichondria panicea TaxID=6063 RepID=UPI00312BA350